MGKRQEKVFKQGIKVSKPGYDVLNLDAKRKAKPEGVDANILYSLATPYVMGARVTVERYIQVALTLESNPVDATNACLHEISCLFEDLATISKYTHICRDKHELDQLWQDARNHIRHDIREEYDKESSIRKNERAARLGLDPRLQTNLGFRIDAIKVGSVVIELPSITDYIVWAAETITDVMNKAREQGRVNATRLDQVRNEASKAA